MISNPSLAHSWTFAGDVGRTLVAAVTNERASVKPWHAVTNPAKTTRGVLVELALVAGIAPPKLRTIPTLP